MQLRNNFFYNLSKDFFYYLEYRKLYAKLGKIKGGFVDITYGGLEMRFLCSPYFVGKAYVSKYQSFDLYFFKNEMDGYLKKYSLKSGDVVFDCGAFHGNFAIYASKILGSSGKVYCFEPDEESYKILETNVKLNNCENVILVKAGLYSREMKIRFKSGNVGSSIDVNGDTEINVVSLDNYLVQNGLDMEKVCFIKMDIEGAEIDALDGMRNLLMEGKPNLAIASYHIVDGKQSCELVEIFLKKLGYSAETGFPAHLTTYAWKE